MKKAQPMPVTQEMEDTLMNLETDREIARLFPPDISNPKDLKKWKTKNSTIEWNRKAKKIRLARKQKRQNRRVGRNRR